MMVFSLLISPYRTLFTDSFSKGDYSWIRTNLKNLINFWFVIIFVAIVMYFFSNYFYLFWIGDKVIVPDMVSVGFMIYVIIFTFDNIVTEFINSVGKLRISIYTAIIAIVSNIPLSIYFAKNLDLGSFGVILATCVSFLPGTVLLSIQAYKLAYNNESGIWNK
jgi:O-antigen/teichoic acid export membrane protein